MPKLRVPDDELDVDELEAAEYDESGGDFEPYDGPEPPGQMMLPGYIKRMFWTYTRGDDPMLKVLFVADETAGKYQGWAGWDNIALTSNVKFKWAPLLHAIGLTIKDVKTKTFVGDETDSRNGDPIERIGNWRPGQDSDDAYVTCLTGREKYNGDWSTRPAKFLPYQEGVSGDDADDEDEDLTDEVELDEEPEDEEAEEEATPTRGRGGRRTAAAQTKTSGGRKRPDTGEVGTPRGTRAGRSTARAATSKASAKPAGRGRGRTTDKDDEPPF